MAAHEHDAPDPSPASEPARTEPEAAAEPTTRPAPGAATDEPASTEPEVRPEYAGVGVVGGVVLLIVVAVAVVIAVAQNTAAVPFRFTWVTVHVPLVVLLLVSALVGLVADEVVGLVWRRRRRRVHTMRQELAARREADATRGAGGA